MNLLLFLFALGLGLMAAVPIGPCQVETVKRAIGGQLRASVVVVLGSASSDAVYGAIALFGIAPVLDVPGVVAAFDGAAVVILWGLAYLTWRHSRVPAKLYGERTLTSRRWAYTTGFLLGMSNPPIVASWLFGVTFSKRLGLIPTPFSAASKAVFIAGAVLGTGGYLSALAVVAHRLRHSFSTRAIATVYRALAIVLLLISFYFFADVVGYFLHRS